MDKINPKLLQSIGEREYVKGTPREGAKMVEVKRPEVEIVYRQGSGYIWSHKPINGIAEQENLPYYITDKRQAREFVRNRYLQRGLDPMSVRISWA